MIHDQGWFWHAPHRDLEGRKKKKKGSVFRIPKPQRNFKRISLRLHAGKDEVNERRNLEKRKEKKSKKKFFLLLVGITAPALRTQAVERERGRTMSQCMSNDGTSSSQSAAAEFDVAQRGRAFFLVLSVCVVFWSFLAQHTVYGMDSNLNSGAARASQKNAACASWPFAARDGGQTPTLITGFGADPLPASSIRHRILDVDGWIDLRIAALDLRGAALECQ